MEGQWQQRGDGEDNGDDSINVEMNTVPSSSGEARARTKDGAQPTRNLASSLGAFVAGVIFCLCAGVVWSHAIAVQSSCQATAASHDDVIRPAVIVVTAMTSEMERWVERLPLGETLPFPGGHEPSLPPLRWNASLRVLGLVTGMGLRAAAASPTALGLDPRVDTRDAHWVLAGIAGIDPLRGSAGSAFWARRLVHGDGRGYEFDPREPAVAARGWRTGFVPHHRSAPWADPPPTRGEAKAETMLYELDPRLVAWASTRSAAEAELQDSDALRAARASYDAQATPAAREPPTITLGDSQTSNWFWAGDMLTEWARNWTAYYSAGEAVFATTQMEDTAVAAAIGGLARAGRANASRLLVLRTASDYSAPPPGVDLIEWFFDDARHMLFTEALEAAYVAGAPVVKALARGEYPW